MACRDNREEIKSRNERAIGESIALLLTQRLKNPKMGESVEEQNECRQVKTKVKQPIKSGKRCRNIWATQREVGSRDPLITWMPSQIDRTVKNGYWFFRLKFLVLLLFFLYDKNILFW